MSELKILVCDDDADLQGLLVRRLEKMGVTPDVASDGRQALGFCEENDYDVIVSDIYMPEATGLEVLQFAKQRDQDTQVVIITSSATLDNAIDALNHGAFGYLTKPFDHLIVFDNMVSRAIEYRHLLVAEKRKAKAQKRRGDMLEDEVAQRVQQLQKKQKGLLDLLGSLPDGILVVEEGGKVVLSSPVGERWLAKDEQSDDRPIQRFIAQVHAEMAEPSSRVQVGDCELQLLSTEFPNDGEAKRKAVIIREVEDSGVGAGSLVTDTVMGIKKGLAALYEQGLGTDIVLGLASQFAVLEQLAGWTGGTGDLATATSPVAPPEVQPVAEQPAEVAQAEISQAEAADSEAPVAAAPLQDPHPTSVSTVPPFMQPRPRIPTAELDGPRMNTAELQEALQAAIDDESEAEAAAPGPAAAIEQPEPAAEQPEPEPAAAIEQPEPAAEEPDPEPAPAIEQPEPAAEEPEPEPAAAIEQPEPAAEIEQPEPAAEQPEPEPAVAEEEGDFPKARSTGDLDSAVFRPRMIPEEMDAKLETPTELPKPNGRRGLLNRAKGPIKIQSPLADTQMFRRVLAGLSGSEVEGLSGEKEGPPEIKPKQKRKADSAKSNGDAKEPEPQAAVELQPDKLPDELEEPELEPELVAEPMTEAEPVPEPINAPAANWPPKLPSKDDDWDDSLEVSD